jgi:hypothetical protein
LCKLSSGTSARQTVGTSVTRQVSFIGGLGLRIADLYATPVASSYQLLLLPSTGSIFLGIYGLNFGSFAASARVSFKGSSPLSFRWFSTSWLNCKAAPFHRNFLVPIAVTVSESSNLGVLLNTSIVVPPSVMSSSLNQFSPSTGAVDLNFAGKSMNLFDSSLQIRVAHSASLLTIWISDSFVITRCRSGIFLNHSAVISLPSAQTTSIPASIRILHPQLSNFQTFCVPVTGSSAVRLIGKSLSEFSGSYGTRVGSSVSESTLWCSDSTLNSKISSGVLAFTPFISTVGLQSNEANPLLVAMYESPKVSSVREANHPVTGSTILTMFGSNFGYAHYSGNVKVDSQECLNYLWISDSTLKCRAPPSFPGSSKIEISIGQRVQTFLGSISYDLANVSSFIFPKSTPTASKLIPSTSTSLLTMIGLDFGGRDPSPTTRLQSSATEMSKWISESTVVAKLCASNYQKSVTSIISIDNTWAYLSNSLVHSELQSTNSTLPPTPRTGNAFIRLSGTEFALFDRSWKVRLASSATETTQWVSDSYLLIRAASGMSIHKRILISADFDVLQLAASVVFDTSNAGIALGFRPQGTFCPVSGCNTVIVPASGLSLSDGSLRGRMGRTAMESTRWLSDSSFIGRPGAFLHDDAVLLITLNAGVQRSQLLGLYDPPLMSSVTPQNIPCTGSIFLSVYGLNFGQIDASIRVFMKRPSLMTTWASDSFVLVKAVRGYDAALISVLAPEFHDIIPTDHVRPLQFFSYDRFDIVVVDGTDMRVRLEPTHPNFVASYSGSNLFYLRNVSHSQQSGIQSNSSWIPTSVPPIRFYSESSQPYDILLGLHFTFATSIKMAECLHGQIIQLMHVKSSSINISCAIQCSRGRSPQIIHSISSSSENVTFDSYFLTSKEFTVVVMHDGKLLKTFVDGSLQSSTFLHGWKLRTLAPALLQLHCMNFGECGENIRSVFYDEALNNRDLDSISIYLQSFIDSEFPWAAITQPQIISITPSSAPVASSSMVTIYASHLGPVSQMMVLFGSAHCQIVFSTSHSVTCQLPRAVGTRKVRIVSSGVSSPANSFSFQDPVIVSVEPSLVHSTSRVFSVTKVSQIITLKGRNFGDAESTEGCRVSLNFSDRRPLAATAKNIFHSDSIIIFEFVSLPAESETVWTQADICGATSNRVLLNVTLNKDPYDICTALAPTYDRRNDDCMHCCRIQCAAQKPQVLAGFCKHICLSKCSVAAASPPDILQLRLLPGHYGDCAVFVWELAPETDISDTIKGVQIEFHSSDSSVPHRLITDTEDTQITSCGFVVGTRIFETKARVIGRMIDTQWFSFSAQFYFTIVTPPSTVQNVSLVFNKVSALNKVQIVVSWSQPLYHGGAVISSYRVQFFLTNGSALNAEQQACSSCSLLWLLHDNEIDNHCSVDIFATNAFGKQSKCSTPCIGAIHREDPVAPIIALSPGGAHTQFLSNISVRPGLWSPAQGFSVFDPLYPCTSLRVSYTTNGRFENIQQIDIVSIDQQDKVWCAFEMTVLASLHGDCADVVVRCSFFLF